MFMHGIRRTGQRICEGRARAHVEDSSHRLPIFVGRMPGCWEEVFRHRHWFHEHGWQVRLIPFIGGFWVYGDLLWQLQPAADSASLDFHERASS